MHIQAKQMILELQEKSQVSLAKLAEQIDMTPSTVQRIANGKIKHCRSDTYFKIKNFYEQSKTPNA